MAIDTAGKRYSMIEFGVGRMDQLPIPDGSFDQADKQHWLSCYSGILFGEIVLSPDICWPLTVAVSNSGATSAAFANWSRATVSLSNNGQTTITKGC
jgi:hypothetical protein